MGGSSIGIDVKAANSKLAQMLRKREEDEALLQVGKKRIKDQAGKEASKSGRQKKAKRWREAADFSHPSPLVDRPRTEAGSTSFHFSYTTVSKEGSPTIRGTPIHGFGGAGKMPGADHSAYVEREGAAEMARGAEHASYLERDGAVELNALQNQSALGIDGIGSEAVGEDLLPDEKTMLGRVEWEATRSVFSNISDDQFEREEYWRAVHRTEREAKKHSIIVDPSSSPKWWREIETWKDVPQDFRLHCLNQRDRYEAWLQGEAKNPRGKPFIPEPYERTSEGCGAAIQAAQNIPGWNLIEPPLSFKSGRGGRVQFRFVAELPHELSPEDRALIVQNFCDHLSTFSKDDNGQPAGMMYTAVIHAPDAHNDRRNYHLHVIAHDRPAKWLDEYQQWDFEVAEQYNHKGEMRTRYPYRQNKVGEVSQGRSKTGREGSGADFIPAMRKRFAEINNAVLKARGIQRRLDPRRYEEMGIDRTPTEHLGTKAAALEAMGVPTVIGRLNAIAIWTDAEKAIRKRATAVDAALKSSQADLRDFVNDAIVADPRAPETRQLRTLVAEREALAADVSADRLELMIFDHLEAKAKSRAVRTRQTCLQVLTEAERIPGLHSKETLKAVRKRYQEAQDHIERVNSELSIDRPRLKAAADDVIRRESRIQAIDDQLAPLRAALMAAVEKERSTGAKKRDQIARESARKAASNQDAKPAAADHQSAPNPASAQPKAPSPVSALPARTEAVPASPAKGAVTPQPRSNEEASTENTDAAKRPARPNLLLMAARLFVSTRQPTSVGPATFRSAEPLSSVRGLSSSSLVRDAARPPVLLQHLQNGIMGRSGLRSSQGSSDGMRRPRSGDPAVAGGNGEGSGRDVNPTAEGATLAPPPILAPPAVQGVPIIEPTLPVGQDAITPPRKPEVGTPEGLSPVIPAVDKPRSAPKVPSYEADLGTDENPIQQPDQNDTGPKVLVPKTRASNDPGAEPSTVENSQEASPPEKIDGRRKVKDPTLFPVQDSVAPTKPGSSKATYEEWDALVNRIARDRIQIVKDKDDRGKVRYDVPSLDHENNQVLFADRFAKRTPGRLAAIHDQQAREIDRLIRWIAKNGRDPEKLVIEGRTAKIGDAPDSVRSLMRDWRTHPKVTQALRSENDRRQQAAADAIRNEARRREEAAKSPAPVSTAASASASNQARLAHLAQIYPNPDDAATKQVRKLIELLRQDAPAEEIQAAAEAVSADPIAREDVHRHRVELAQAYNTAMEDDVTRLIRGFDRKGGR